MAYPSRQESLDLEGTASTFGLPSLANHRARNGKTVARPLRNAGAIVLGKINVAQLLMYYRADNTFNGAVKIRGMFSAPRWEFSV